MCHVFNLIPLVLPAFSSARFPFCDVHPFLLLKRQEVAAAQRLSQAAKEKKGEKHVYTKIIHNLKSS